ncbi:hypothetical protein FB45DRAFT_931900 [Roridomyces roridus]|uniref:Uncharacterized protein n=1 Tax=Roridomyces roridus TaxID=1738132 RepID=A0AAD7BEQ5_9AGAR|nr:hypothetical protein FB45DRAFT_931900 [Roridomyces roridus]
MAAPVASLLTLRTSSGRLVVCRKPILNRVVLQKQRGMTGGHTADVDTSNTLFGLEAQCDRPGASERDEPKNSKWKKKLTM